MIIGSISENKNLEKRVSITPDIIKKYNSLGFKVYLNKNYASHLGINDSDYEIEGAKILENEDIFGRGNKLEKVYIDNSFPKYITKSKDKLSDWII